MPPTDLELIDRYQTAADSASLDTLMTRHYPAVYRVVLNLVHNEADASDLAQSTFVRVLQKAGEFRGEGRFRAWILAIAINEVQQHWRRGRNVPRTDPRFEEVLGHASTSDPDGVSQSASRREFEQALEQAFESFPPRLKLPIVLHYFEEMSFAEIAAALELSKSTVQSRCERAVGRLRDFFKKRGFSALLPMIPERFPGIRPAGLTSGVVPAAVALALVIATVSLGWWPWFADDSRVATESSTRGELTSSPRVSTDVVEAKVRATAIPQVKRQPIDAVARRDVHTTGPGMIIGFFHTADNQPIAGATITVSFSYHTQSDYMGADDPRWFVNTYPTDANGRFVCDQLDPRHRYDLYLRHASTGYRGVKSIGFPLGIDRVDLGVILTTRGFAVDGTVVSEKGQPIEGVSITVGDYATEPALMLAKLPASPLRGSTGRTDARGHFRCDGLSAGLHRIVASHPDWAPASCPEVRVERDGSFAPLQITMRRPAALTGRVADDSGAAIPGAIVKVSLAEQHIINGRGYSLSRYLRRVVTDDQGTFAVNLIPRIAGSHLYLNCTAPGFEDGHVGNLVPGRNTVHVTLDRTHPVGRGPLTITGQLALPNRAWPSGRTAVIEVASVDAQEETVRNESNPQSGRVRVPGLTPGPKKLRIHAIGCRPYERDLPLAGNIDLGMIELDPGCTIFGTIVDRITKVPIANARLRATGNRVTRTDAAGRFEISGFQRMDGNSYGSLTIDAKGYLKAQPGVRLSATLARVRQDFALSPSGSSPDLEGVVQDASGQPIAGAKVRAYLVTNSVYAWQVRFSDTAGRFKFPGLTDRSISSGSMLLVTRPGFAACRVLIDADRKTHEVTLDSGRQVSGRVIDTSGQPVVGARISISLPGAKTTRLTGLAPAQSINRTITDRLGRFTVDRAPSARICVQALHSNCRPATGDAFDSSAHFLDAGASRPITLILARGRELKGRVVAPLGQPIAGVIVFGNGVRSGGVVTDHAGRFRFPAVYQTAVDLRIRADSYMGTLEKASPGTDAIIVARPCGKLIGVFVDRAGQPAALQEITCTAGTESWTTKTGPQGEFRFDRVPAGEVELRAGSRQLVRHEVKPHVPNDVGVLRGPAR